MEKLTRADGAMGYHYYCSKCHRMFLIEEVGCNYCSNCGYEIAGWSDKLKTRYDDEQQVFETYYWEDLNATEENY